MGIADHIRIGPFSTTYHRTLVDGSFIEKLDQFLEQQLLPQLDAPLRKAEGTLTAAFDADRFCGPNSLVRDIFTLEVVLVGDAGTSELKSDIVFDRARRSFSPRGGQGHDFYLQTPTRKKHHQMEIEAIQRLVDDVNRGRQVELKCPICGGAVFAVNDSQIFDVRCTNQHCFQYNYHKDELGRLAHGHFFTKHPQRRGGESGSPTSS